MDSEKEILFSIDGPVATIRFNRPKQGNALSPDLFFEFKNILQELKGNWKVRVIVLTGNGKYFCTGMDLGAKNQKNMISVTVCFIASLFYPPRIQSLYNN